MIIMYLNWNFFHVLNNVFWVFDSGDISIFYQLEFPSGPTQAQARVPPLLYTHKALVNIYNVIIWALSALVLFTIMLNSSVPPPIQPGKGSFENLNASHGPLSYTPNMMPLSIISSLGPVLPMPRTSAQKLLLLMLWWMKDNGFHL